MSKQTSPIRLTANQLEVLRSYRGAGDTMPFVSDAKPADRALQGKELLYLAEERPDHHLVRYEITALGEETLARYETIPTVPVIPPSPIFAVAPLAAQQPERMVV